MNKVLLRTFALLVLIASNALSHEGHSHDEKANETTGRPTKPTDVDSSKIELVNTNPDFVFTGTTLEKDEENTQDMPKIARHFGHFESIKARWNATTLFVESTGLPDHNMMVGIKSWQQQVPLPQPYTGKNAWQIPRKPEIADKPVSAKNNLYRGAIALAVNGIPIFNALNNRGDDTYLAGELDKWGGHCGGGDDYHYHVAPLHLQKIVGKKQPIAYALDGYPIYGLKEPDGSTVKKLDEFNGHFDEKGNYHYHATKKFPYINGGMRGVVAIRGDQIEPQPRDMPARPPMEPLRGATITKFKSSKDAFLLTYTVRGETGTVAYEKVGKDSWEFTYSEPGYEPHSETYQRRQRNRGGGKQNEKRGGKRPPPRR